MTTTGLGQKGYFRGQTEAVYNTALISSPTLYSLKSGTLGFEQTQIEKKNQAGSVIPQKPEAGDKKVGPADLVFEVPAEQFSDFMNWVQGASTNAGAGAITHTWLVPTTGSTTGVSKTCEQAIGGDLAGKYSGLKVTKWSLEGKPGQILDLTMTVVGVDRNDAAVTRATTFTVSANACYKFADCVLQITPASVSQFTQQMNGFKLAVDYGYKDDGQRFQAGSYVAVAPVFNTPPVVTFSCEIDAEQRFEDWAVSMKDFKIDLTITSTVICNVATKYSVAFEIPVAQLKPSTKREAGNDLLPLTLDFTVYGGTTTGSASAIVPMEIRTVDATATWPTYA